MIIVRVYIRKDVVKGFFFIYFEWLDDCWIFLILGVIS